jgi:protein TonB
MAANLVFAPRPEYPALARLAHAQGEVVLEAVVSRDGSVSATRILSGNRLLRGAAAAAVRRWRYRPYIANGRPVDVSTIVTIGFHANR